MSINQSNINQILVISLSNIGDVILTFPVIDILLTDFPKASLSIVVGPKAVSLCQGNPYYQDVFVFDKKMPWTKRFSWIRALGKTKFDLIVDLRHTAMPLMLAHRYRTSIFKTKNGNLHMKEKHLRRLKEVYSFKKESKEKKSVYLSEKDKGDVANFIQKKITGEKDFIIMAPGAANQDKRWPQERFSALSDFIYQKYQFVTVFVGDANDREIAEGIRDKMNFKAINGCGELTLIQLAYLMQRSRLVISNDSCPMHLASYLNIPVVAVFGPSNPSQYGPWGNNHSYYVQGYGKCARCQNPQSQERHICMEIDMDQVAQKVEKILSA